MKNDSKNPMRLFHIGTAQDGFTLIELMIALVIATILGIAMVTNFVSQQRSSAIVRQVANMQQQLRGAMFILEQDIRIAGYDPQGAGLFGVFDVGRRNIVTGDLDLEGSPSLTVAFDWSPGNLATNDNGLLDEPAPTYRLQDNGNGSTDLVRVVGGNVQLLAENIEAFSLAYAYDNGDGTLARSGGEVIWAADTINDNRLDTRVIEGDDDEPLAEVVTLDRVRSVRIWLLARAQDQSPGFVNTEIYQVGGDALPPFMDGFRRRLLVRTIDIRNMGL
jgi:type IV pilus assembly protein PilW